MALCFVGCGNRHGTKHGSVMENNTGSNPKRASS